jgi:hypothetical protein
MADWMIPKVSVPSQLQREMDRRKAARLSRDDLAVLSDKLIFDWYQHSALIDQLLGEVRQLQVKLALAGDPIPARRGASPEHYEWVRQLTGRQPTGQAEDPPDEQTAQAAQ